MRCVFVLLLFVSLFHAEAIAQAPRRNWKDSTGKFEVAAELVSRTDNAVRLKKTDGRVVTVPIEKLCDADKAYLKELNDDKNAENPFAGGEKMAEKETPPSDSGDLFEAKTVKTLSSVGREVFINIDEPVKPLKPDPTPYKAKFRQFARPLENLDAYARVSQPVLIDPEVPYFAVSTHRVANNVRKELETFGRLYLVGESKRTEPVLDIDQTLKLFDHHVKSGLSLAAIGVNRPSERSGDIVLLEGLAAGTPKPIARWRTPGWEKPGFKPKIEFARLIDASTALVCVNYSVYLWDLQTGELDYFIKRVQRPSELVVSGTGKYLAIPASNGAYLIDVAKGELLGKLPLTSSLTPDVRFSPDGKMLAMTYGHEYTVWDLETVRVKYEGHAGISIGKFHGWIDNSSLLTGLGGLIDLEHGMPLWRYSLPSGSAATTVSGGVIAMDKGSPTTMLSLQVPHKAVDELKQRLDDGPLDDMLLLAPGDEVSVTMKVVEGVDQEKMLAGLKRNLAEIGWKVVDNAETVMVAEVTRGKEEEMQFRNMFGSIFSRAQTVKTRPCKATLKLTQNGKTIWSHKGKSMFPPVIQLKEGEAVSDAVKRLEKADPKYFERANIPPKILKPEFASMIGRSNVSNGRWRDW
jgi:hypothetical protein